MAKKKTIAAPSPPLTGNVFEYFVPRLPPESAPLPKTQTAPKAKAQPIPTATASPTRGKPKYPKPGKFFKHNFARTDKANFGTKGHLGGRNHVIHDIQVVRAALECGYGSRSNWTSALALKPHEATGLANYLMLRLQMVASCIEVDSDKARLPRSFYARVEASEKVALSFILGGIGTYLAACKWLEAGGDSVGAFLHAGIYTKGVNGAAPMMTFPSTSGKTPDYLVASGKGAWHVFESKGGISTNRWARIVEGLVQMANLPNIAWTAGSVAKPATTSVCVHTSVDPGRTLHVTAVDPPGDGLVEEGKPHLMLIEGVCKLLLLLETLGQYHALADNIIPNGDLEVADWKMATSSHFGGLIVGVPERYLLRERDVRRRQAVFLAVSEVLADPAFVESKGNKTELLIERVEQKFTPQALGEGTLVIPSSLLRRIVTRIAGHLGQEDFLFHCSQHLRLNRAAQQLMPSVGEQVFFRLRRDMPYVVTSGGMYLEQLTPNTPLEDVAIQPFAPRG